MIGKIYSKLLQLEQDNIPHKKVSEEELQRRLTICEGCPSFTGDRECGECGCPIDFKASLEWIDLTIKNWAKNKIGIRPKEIIKTNINCPLKKWKNEL